MRALLTKFFGSRNERVIKKLQRKVEAIDALEPAYKALSDAELSAKTQEFKYRLQTGTQLDDLLVEAFAVVREASSRVLGMRHFRAQLLGGMVLHEGKISEMKTGEGKTLVASLPLYLNALMGKGVHLITVNDYLAKRDAATLVKLYEFLGLSVGTIVSQMSQAERRQAYHCDITYGTNHELGFDYLRDNMVLSPEDKVQRELYFALVDEVDSILIDEARTPLIISGPSQDLSALYHRLVEFVPKLQKRLAEDGEGDYYTDEKARQVFLTEAGHEHLERLLKEAGLLQEDSNLYDPLNVSLMHYVNAVLRAYTLFHKDVDYMVRDGEILIVDEHTGRAMIGRRWSDGLHQGIEAKEGVKIQPENQTLASITYQNYFRLYQKLGGMTGTADTEAYEFQEIYDLEVVVIPTHRPMIRKDYADMVFLTAPEKYRAIVKEIQRCHEKSQPVLVGTTSIEVSELLSDQLTQAGIVHAVLNAKQHDKEAQIIAEAGRPKAVTIATNMAGRGTDIILGGNYQSEIRALEEPSVDQISQIKADWQVRHDLVLAVGGLHIIGSERHESRRVDNQLRGRAGRQGDPGSSRFYLSIEDNLLRIFTPPWVQAMLRKAGMGKDEALENGLITTQIGKAQKRVENFHFDVRKNLLQFDNIINDQRKVIYAERSQLLNSQSVGDIITHMRQEVVQELLKSQFHHHQSTDTHARLSHLAKVLVTEFDFQGDLINWGLLHKSLEGLEAYVIDTLIATHEQKRQQTSAEVIDQFEKTILLKTLDNLWREHLHQLDHLRQSIHLRGYAQKDPKQEYKREAFALFSSMLDRFRYQVISVVSRVKIELPNPASAAQERLESVEEISSPDVVEPMMPKVGRNDPCPCGSGERFKSCHGKISG